MFINDLSDAIEWIEYNLCEFMQDTEWGGGTGTLNRRAVVRRDVNKLEN